MYQGYATTMLRTMLRQRHQIAKEHKTAAKLHAKRRDVHASNVAYDGAVLHLTECLNIQREIDRRNWTHNGPAQIVTA